MGLNRSCRSAALAFGVLAGLAGSAGADLQSDFSDPPLAWKTRPLWFWNGPLEAGRTRAMLQACKERGYYGVGILPAHGMVPAFMTPAFLDHYQVAVDEAARLGMKLCLYDEYWFPSGSAGGLLAKRHPEALSKRLDMVSTNLAGPMDFVQAVPHGTFMGAVAMNLATQKRENISRGVERRPTDLAGAGRGLEGHDLHLRARRRGRAGGLPRSRRGAAVHLAHLRGLLRQVSGTVRHHHRQRLLRRADVPLGAGRAGLDGAVQREIPREVRIGPGQLLSGPVVRHRPGNGRRAQRAVRVSRRAVRHRVSQNAQRLVPRASPPVDRPRGPGGDCQPGRACAAT